MSSFVLKGNICHSISPDTLQTVGNAYLVCENGISSGIFKALPERFANLPLADYGDNLIVPGLCDLHIHAPQYAFRALGMDLELLEWLNTHTFPEESKYARLDYARRAYAMFADDLRHGATTRVCVFATLHEEATFALMDLLENAGLAGFAGKVNMDRNSPDYLCETTEQSLAGTKAWIEGCGKYKNIRPILTPRFIPTCSDALMRGLKELQTAYGLPVQSHLSENKSEIAWVKALCPESLSYGDAYNRFGLFGGGAAPTVMAHCTWSDADEAALMKRNGVFAAHCPQSNTNLASGIAPVRKFLDMGIRIGLGSDVAGGCHTSIFRAMSDAIQVSKLRWRLVDQNDAPLTVREAFYLGTRGGGGFFGKVGAFDAGFEFDAVVVDDKNLTAPSPLSLEDRLARIVYLSDDRNIAAKYVRGATV